WRAARSGVREVLVVLPVALCFVFVAACLLSLRGLQQSLTLRLGFGPQGVSVVAFDAGLAGYTQEQGQNLQRRTLEGMKQLPGVVSAAYSNSVPLSIDQSDKGSVSEDVPNPKRTDDRSAIV